MKFTNGQWLMRDGVTAAYPTSARRVTADEQRLEVLAPTFPVRHRGDLLKGPVLTVELSSPLPDVIAVQVTHFAGGHAAGPDFAVRVEDTPDVAVEITDEEATLTSGALTARVSRGEDWALEFLAEGHLLTRSATKALALVTDDGQTHLREQPTEEIIAELVTQAESALGQRG